MPYSSRLPFISVVYRLIIRPYAHTFMHKEYILMGGVWLLVSIGFNSHTLSII